MNGRILGATLGLVSLVLGPSAQGTVLTGPAYKRASHGNRCLLVMAPQSLRDDFRRGSGRWSPEFQQRNLGGKETEEAERILRLYPANGVYANNEPRSLLWTTDEYWLPQTILTVIENAGRVYTVRSTGKQLLYLENSRELAVHDLSPPVSRLWMHDRDTISRFAPHYHRVDPETLELHVRTAEGLDARFDIRTGALLLANTNETPLANPTVEERSLLERFGRFVTALTKSGDEAVIEPLLERTVVRGYLRAESKADMMTWLSGWLGFLREGGGGVETSFGGRSRSAPSPEAPLLRHARGAEFDVYRIPATHDQRFLFGFRSAIHRAGSRRSEQVYGVYVDVVTPRALRGVMTVWGQNADGSWRINALLGFLRSRGHVGPPPPFPLWRTRPSSEGTLD